MRRRMTMNGAQEKLLAYAVHMTERWSYVRTDGGAW